MRCLKDGAPKGAPYGATRIARMNDAKISARFGHILRGGASEDVAHLQGKATIAQSALRLLTQCSRAKTKKQFYDNPYYKNQYGAKH
jgi:hypothetical protein